MGMAGTKSTGEQTRSIPGTECPFGWGVSGPLWLCSKWDLVLKNLQLQVQEYVCPMQGNKQGAVVRPRLWKHQFRCGERACRMGGWGIFSWGFSHCLTTSGCHR